MCNKIKTVIASSIWHDSNRRSWQPRLWTLIWIATAWLGGIEPASVQAQDRGTIGVTLLVLEDPTLTGSGVRMAQVEAGFPNWEVNSTNIQPAAVFNYYGSNGTTTAFPNSLGLESDHADEVGALLYGPQGVVPGISIVDNYEGNYFENDLLVPGLSIPALLINQSFVNTSANAQQQAQGDNFFDNYAAQHSVLFISGAGNGGAVDSPGSCYNGLGVGAYGGASSVGPTPDNGRCKPDITAPAGATSFSTPQVSGAAAILWQAANRGDGGAGTTSIATAPKTIKALLLNGAVKPADWTNSTVNPFDFRYGSGILNVFNSWYQLKSGRVAQGQTSNTKLIGWDNATITVQPGVAAINHYYFQIPAGAGQSSLLSTTLVWEKHAQSTSINNLDLNLYHTEDNSLAASSQSQVDNVQHLFIPGLRAGAYDLQVVSSAPDGILPFSASENYALALSLTSGTLTIQQNGNGIQLVWPLYPAGSVLQEVTSLGTGMDWTNPNSPATIVNGQNVVTLTGLGATMFFRLAVP